MAARRRVTLKTDAHLLTISYEGIYMAIEIRGEKDNKEFALVTLDTAKNPFVCKKLVETQEAMMMERAEVSY
ncbi:MAG: hypothetical protein V1804_01335 [Patescibacteria group bacterium]